MTISILDKCLEAGNSEGFSERLRFPCLSCTFKVPNSNKLLRRNITHLVSVELATN